MTTFEQRLRSVSLALNRIQMASDEMARFLVSLTTEFTLLSLQLEEMKQNAKPQTDAEENRS